jgi:hypothetical protein
MTQAYNTSFIELLNPVGTVKEVDKVKCNNSYTAWTGKAYTACDDTGTNKIWIKKSLSEKTKNKLFWHESGHLLFCNKSDKLMTSIMDSTPNPSSDPYFNTSKEKCAELFSLAMTGDAKPNIGTAYVLYKLVLFIISNN